MNRIKRFLSISFAALAAMAAMSCETEEDMVPEPVQIEVNANNISGKWQLVEWNGAGLAEGTYVYLDIVRNDKTYTMYQNLDSFTNVPHVVTGSYFIETDPELGAIIRGNYDHDSGDWAHRYIVKSLTDAQMVWVAKDDEAFIQVFDRVDTIPVASTED